MSFYCLLAKSKGVSSITRHHWGLLKSPLSCMSRCRLQNLNPRLLRGCVRQCFQRIYLWDLDLCPRHPWCVQMAWPSLLSSPEPVAPFLESELQWDHIRDKPYWNCWLPFRPVLHVREYALDRVRELSPTDDARSCLWGAGWLTQPGRVD